MAAEAGAPGAAPGRPAPREGCEPDVILVVDDDPETLRHVRDALAEAGYAPLVTGEAVFRDRELSGFGVRVYPSGAKVYLVETRAGGKSRRVTIGRHGLVSAEQARRKAATLIAGIKAREEPGRANGASPSGNGPMLAELGEVIDALTDLFILQGSPGSPRILAVPLQCRTPTWQPGIPATGSGNDRRAKLAARLRYAPPVIQLGGKTVNVLTFKPDRSTGAGQQLSRYPLEEGWL